VNGSARPERGAFQAIVSRPEDTASSQASSRRREPPPATETGRMAPRELRSETTRRNQQALEAERPTRGTADRYDMCATTYTRVPLESKRKSAISVRLSPNAYRRRTRATTRDVRAHKMGDASVEGDLSIALECAPSVDAGTPTLPGATEN
jgi:hypothetical protein